MYKCTKCGGLFEEPEQIRSYMGGYGSEKCFENEAVSPCCHSDFTEVQLCKCCENNCAINGEEYCKDCKNRVLQDFQYLLGVHFTKEERELINFLIEEGITI